MDVKPIQCIARDKIEQLLQSIPFYRAVQDADNWQYEQLIQHSQLVEYRADECVIRRGQDDAWLYFLLRGRLEVFAGDMTLAGASVAEVTPGEVFGDLAMLDQRTRMASVVVRGRPALVFRTNFAVFGALDDFSRINLNTKLLYYRNMVHSLRWKLEVYRMNHPASELAEVHRAVRLYMGAKDTLQELLALHDQAAQLAALLVDWNREFGQLHQQQAEFDQDVIDSIDVA